MWRFGIKTDKNNSLAPNYEPPTEIRNLYKWNWDADFIKYLGVTLPKGYSKMFNLNCGPLNSMIKIDIQRWNVIPFLSLSSRTDTFRFNVLMNASPFSVSAS